MPVLIGIILIPVIIAIIKVSNLITTKKHIKIILNILLIIIPIIYIVLCLIIGAEPFDFEEHYSIEYMIFRGEYILNAGIIFVFTPFIWIVVFYFLRMIFRSIRVRKNAIIKRDEEYIYYRGDLDKVSPSIIMFTSTFDVDMKKSISATILKLKLTGYIKEEDSDHYIFTNKDTSHLLESEKMVLNLIRDHYFDKNKYEEVVRQEALHDKYVVKNRGGIPFRVLKIFIAICMPIIIFILSVGLDEYVFENYRVYPADDGHTYIMLKNEEDIEQLYYNEVTDENDYYHRPMADGSFAYNYAEIRADKFEYSVVRKAFCLNIITTLIIGFFVIFILIALYSVVDQIIYIRKNYRRTIKGKILLNKAYALKNYLKEYSLMKNRTENELVLWEYYLVYAVILDVNVKIKDKIIEKYVRNIV